MKAIITHIEVHLTFIEEEKSKCAKNLVFFHNRPTNQSLPHSVSLPVTDVQRTQQRSDQYLQNTSKQIPLFQISKTDLKADLGNCFKYKQFVTFANFI